jgi:YVTN family beta-propeller protein
VKLRLCRLLAAAAFASCFLGSVQILAQNAYITNHGSGNVSVIDTATNKVTATIAVGGAPFGVAVSPDGGTVYVANTDSGNVSVIATTTNTVVDTATNKVIATIPVVASHPWYVLLEMSSSGSESGIRGLLQRLLGLALEEGWVGDDVIAESGAGRRQRSSGGSAKRSSRRRIVRPRSSTMSRYRPAGWPCSSTAHAAR